MKDRSGEQIRDYQLLEYAGEGTFASVYRARHILLDHIRAVKIIHPEHLTNPDYVERFKLEAQVVASLEHPHIVSLHEFWTDNDGAYIVMQWMEGGSLEGWLSAMGRLPPLEVSELLAQIAPALSLVHRNQVVHRDLKPANILMDADDGFHIADFGLAKRKQYASDLSIANALIGTPAYMSPEQANPDSNGGLTSAADIYAIGVMLFELLTGTHPFGKTDAVSMILHQLRDPMPSIHDVAPDLPDNLDPIIQRATAKDPNERYPDVIALAEAFQTAVLGRRPQRFLETSTLEVPEVKAAGDLNARVYERAGAIMEAPRRLMGREDLVERVMQQLVEHERVLLHGMAGIGKTALAAKIAGNYIDADQGHVIWVELGRQNADTLFEALARALGKHQQIASTQGAERILAIREMLLDEEKALIVIDNIWNEEAMLPIIQAIPHTTPLLMTSRTAISIDGLMLHIDALDETEALKLLGFYARHDYADDESAVELCNLLGNHPYAIEMAGKRLQTYRHLTPERLINDIKDAPHGMVVTGALGISKQRTVKDLLDESVNELPEHLRELLVLMGGLYSSRASIELFSMVANLEPSLTEHNLAELERNGLVRLVLDGDTCRVIIGCMT